MKDDSGSLGEARQLLGGSQRVTVFEISTVPVLHALRLKVVMEFIGQKEI